MTPYLLHQILAPGGAPSPEHLAVLDRSRSLSYGALDDASNQLANALHRQGVRKGDRVGIDLEKSLEAAIAMFGILKAGAAYVPIDPRAPARRAAFLITDCRMKGLVTTRARLENLRPALARLPHCLIQVDAQADSGAMAWADVLRGPTAPPPDPQLIEQDLAYILYTSGSTGEPKGVMLSHRAALSFVNWTLECFQLGPADRLSNHAPLHFDLSILDIFGAAAAGATVALVPAAVSVFPRSLADWIEAMKITVWYSVPSALTQLALNGALGRHSYASLRLVLFAGEVFPVQHLRRLMEQIPRAAYFNLYGPTETNVCTVQAVAPPAANQREPAPIGRACANTEVFAVNEQGEPLVAGNEGEPVQLGELYVRGPTLMQGYWGRAEQTRAMLVPNPLHPERLEHVYRTGDLVRLAPNGEYHFIGRRDAQVKSRGYRIELGEVEAALYRHAGIEEAAVVAQPHAEFGCTLRAIVVGRTGAALIPGELAAFCADHLPPYMIPAEFEIRNSALPKTSSGKVDRKALQTAP